LAQSSQEVLLSKWKSLETTLSNDRALLRALHFYQENKRVEAAFAAIRQKKPASLLKQLDLSGRSSATWLQNVYQAAKPTVQKVTLALALTQLFLDRIGDGCCRIHGGGFAGGILCVIPIKCADDYVAYMSDFLNEGGIYPISIRQKGAVCLSIF
jgi:galactokinase